MSSRTGVKGDTVSDLCRLRAALLNLSVYDTPGSEVRFQCVAPTPGSPAADVPAEFLRAMEENNANWDRVWKRDDPVTGYRCDFYVPKEKGSNPKECDCPPILVFRGSDMQFDNLDFSVSLEGTLDIDIRWWRDRHYSFSLGRSSKYDGKGSGDLFFSGMAKEPLFENVQGQETFRIEHFPSGSNATLKWTANAALYYGTKGDWATNFAQGLGRVVPDQYLSAINDGLEAARIATTEYGKRIIVVGHSLGGGLASAAVTAMSSLNHDLKIFSDTYNAAGLHEHTAAYAFGTRDTASLVPIRARYVSGEILNSLQAETRIIPFISDLLAWGKKKLPAAVADPTPSQGLSANIHTYAEKGKIPKFDPLPRLFPLSEKEFGEELTVLKPIIGYANAAKTVDAFVGATVQYLIREVSRGDTLTIWEVMSIKKAFKNFDLGSTFSLERMKEAVANKRAPQLSLSGDDYIVKHVQPFLNELLRDLFTVGLIIETSAHYHKFPVCAFTFMLKKPG